MHSFGLYCKPSETHRVYRQTTWYKNILLRQFIWKGTTEFNCRVNTYKACIESVVKPKNFLDLEWKSIFLLYICLPVLLLSMCRVFPKSYQWPEQCQPPPSGFFLLISFFPEKSNGHLVWRISVESWKLNLSYTAVIHSCWY